MSTSVTGFAPPDEHWAKMKAVWDACEVAGVDVPESVVDFFGDNEPDEAGIEIELPLRKWNGGLSGAGYELAVADIPSHVTLIRFFNSW
jgi:hypothetical protein